MSMRAVAEFFELTADERFAKTQAAVTRLSRHRHSVRNESPHERARRQSVRAYELARSLGSTKPGVVRSMLALVVADEVINPKGDPPPPAAPGARAALEPKTKPKSQPVVEGVHNRTPDSQIGFWE